MTALALQTSAASRFRSGFSPSRQTGGAMVRAGGQVLRLVGDVAPAAPSASRQITRPRGASLVPSRAPKSDTAGSVVSGALPAALTLLGAKVIDRSRVGQAVKEFTGGAELSDVAGASALLFRMTGLDNNLPSVRPMATRLIVGKLFDWAARGGDAIGDVMDDWERLHAAKKTKDDAKAKADGEKVATKAAEVAATV